VSGPLGFRTHEITDTRTGIRTLLTYDQTYPRPWSTSHWWDCHFQHAAQQGQAGIVSSPGGYSESYVYDAYGRLQDTTTAADATSFVLSNSYSATTGLLETVTYPTSTSAVPGSRFKVKYEYDYGQLKRVRDFNTPTTTYWEQVATNASGQAVDEQFVSEAFEKVQTWFQDLWIGDTLHYRGRVTSETQRTGAASRASVVSSAAEWLRSRGLITYTPGYSDKWAVENVWSRKYACEGEDFTCGGQIPIDAITDSKSREVGVFRGGITLMKDGRAYRYGRHGGQVSSLDRVTCRCVLESSTVLPDDVLKYEQPYAKAECAPGALDCRRDIRRRVPWNLIENRIETWLKK